jgi:hypothetical protein
MGCALDGVGVREKTMNCCEKVKLNLDFHPD